MEDNILEFRCEDCVLHCMFFVQIEFETGCLCHSLVGLCVPVNGAECKAWINWYDFMVVYISEGYHYRRCDFVAQKDHFVVFNFRHGIRLAKWSSNSLWVCGASRICAHNM